MARKIKSSFCDVSIHTDGHLGASSYNNDAFYKVMACEIAKHSDYEDVSSPHLVKKVSRVKRKKQSPQCTATYRDYSESLEPEIFFGIHFIATSKHSESVHKGNTINTTSDTVSN